MNAAYTGHMDELQTLREELAALRLEVKNVKRARWISPGSLAFALIALVAIGVAAPKLQDPQTPPTGSHAPTQLAQNLTCKSIQVVDQSGKTMAMLGSDKDGGYFVLNGADGKKRFFTAIENSAGFSDWYDAAGMRRATVFIGDSGNAEIHLADKLEHVAAVMQQANSGGFMSLAGPDGKNKIAAGVDNGGGYLDLSDAVGNLRESFYLSDKNTAQFKLLGSDKVNRFVISGDPAAGHATSFDADGKTKGVFP